MFRRATGFPARAISRFIPAPFPGTLRDMSADRQFRNLALVGFMGTGKSTVGHVLADLLGFELVDTDKVIEHRAGKRVSEIFAAEGEPAFRQREADLVRELESASGKVISTGGGMIVNPDNLESLRRHSLVVCLWASPGVIFERVRYQAHRPLLQTENPLERIRELLQARAPYYKQADVLVGVDFRAPIETARFIVASFRRQQAGQEQAAEVRG
jgi:shikimate kinase